VLSQAPEETIQRLIIDKRPEQLKMELHLWCRAAVMQLIEQGFDIKMPVRSVGKYLSPRGFTPRKPIKSAYEQSLAAVQARLEGEYPAIERRCRAKGAEIQSGDETARVNTDVRDRSLTPAGKTPVAIAVGGTRHKLSVIATVTNPRWPPQTAPLVAGQTAPGRTGRIMTIPG